MTTTQFMRPHVAHNQTLLRKFLDERGINSQWPPVVDQLESHVVEGVPAGSYNPSIIRFKGNLVLAYRYHPEATKNTRIGIAELDEPFRVTQTQALEIHDEVPSHEDPRLFIWKDELYLCYVSSHWPNIVAANVKYCRIYKADHWRCDTPVDYPHKDRDTLEKNHLPFPCGDVLRIIYRTNPKQIVYTANTNEEFVTEPLTWPYGEIRGGTTPLPYDGKLIRFFHSRINNDCPPTPWRYFIGAMLMQPEPPFKALAISRKPILIASEVGGDLTLHHAKRSIVFPAGAIEHEGGWLLSIGINDSHSALVKIKPQNLNL
jgi:predicted GH43/DUF377 family glycosyl hydrolase